MENIFDRQLDDVRAGHARLREQVGDLYRETRIATAALQSRDPQTDISAGRILIAEKLWTRMKLERCSRETYCNDCSPEVMKSVRSVAITALFNREISTDSFDLDAMKITVFVVRCFNTAMVLTQCRLCAVALVWELVYEEQIKELKALVRKFQSV
ncbi:MAG: hypothetical protein B7Y80_13995 [Hyphomicrobium sp. 32-62-53]|nr:MAG: hypothetical protein B7Z29_07545 [Hyphomicrobium sp. 12-62-95]OYX98819.1 MAG: hypothetical protein B7Y80_13995 [Hyphomicrobium sp. 32-62-53]